jgi:EAL domain-containing protein (putative c-di-GMP-specific phosphodiesterase class I)
MPGMFAPPGSIAIYFRPLVSLGARRVIGFTAHSARPGDEILRAACRVAARWPDGITLGVELSPARWHDPSTGLRVLAVLGETGLPPARLELDISEDEMLGGSRTMLRTIEELRQAGVMAALTGCGRSTEPAATIKLFDTMKFGEPLVQRLGHDASAGFTADVLIELAIENGVVPAADGIDTEAQLELLNARGCAEGQGKLFGKSVLADDIAPLLRFPGLADAVA